MKFKRSIVIPGMLMIYLAVMAILGYPDYAAGITSAQEYFGIIAVTMLVIVLLHLNIKHRDRMQQRGTMPECGATLENTPPLLCNK